MDIDKIWIQLLLLVGIAVVTVLLTRSTADARHQAVRRVLLVLFAVATALAILFPSILSRVARLVGVGRGTDLLLYLLVIAFLSFIATTYRRMKATDRRITELTRELALTEARLERAGLPTAHQAGDGGTSRHPDPAPPAPASQALPQQRADAPQQPPPAPDSAPDTP